MPTAAKHQRPWAAPAALLLGLAAAQAAAQTAGQTGGLEPPPDRRILSEAHDESGMGFGVVPRTPRDRVDDARPPTPADGYITEPARVGEDPSFGYYYQWNPGTEQWDLHYGYHVARYQFGPTGTGQAQQLRDMQRRPAPADADLQRQWDRHWQLRRQEGQQPQYRGYEPWNPRQQFGPQGNQRPRDDRPWEERMWDDRTWEEQIREEQESFDWGSYDEQRAFPAAFRPRPDVPARGAQTDDPRWRVGAPMPRVGGQGAMRPRGGVAVPVGERRSAGGAEVGGMVEEMFYTNIPGVANENVLLRLRLAGEPEQLVHLGSALSPHQLEQIERARVLEVRGRPMSVDGRTVLMADRVTVDGYTFGVRQDGVPEEP